MSGHHDEILLAPVFKLCANLFYDLFSFRVLPRILLCLDPGFFHFQLYHSLVVSALKLSRAIYHFIRGILFEFLAHIHVIRILFYDLGRRFSLVGFLALPFHVVHGLLRGKSAQQPVHSSA